MRNIHPVLLEKLQSGATTLCRCWLLERRDGQAIGFTDHDQDLTFDGITFAAGSGLDASAIESSTGLSVDNTQAIGALTGAGLTEADIRAGLYDSAAVRLWLVDWAQPELRVLLFRGFLGEIEHGKALFEVELRGLSEVLNKTVGRSYLPVCDRLLGDAKCGVDLSQPGFVVVAAVTNVRDNRAVWANGISALEDGWFEFGTLEWMSGANKGAVAKVKFDTVKAPRRIIEIWEEAALPIEIGDQFRLTVGCNKSAQTCKAKFNNINNFRGFPDIPGDDWVAAYPDAEGKHDGGSLKNA